LPWFAFLFDDIEEDFQFICVAGLGADGEEWDI
jgi:hypothetical protein